MGNELECSLKCSGITGSPSISIKTILSKHLYKCIMNNNFFLPFSACGAFYAKAGVCYMVDTDPDKVYKNASLLNINADVNYFIRI